MTIKPFVLGWCLLVCLSAGVGPSLAKSTAPAEPSGVVLDLEPEVDVKDDVDNTAPAESARPPAASTSPVRPPGPGPAALQALPSGSHVAVIPIEGLIYDFTLESLQRRVDRALAAGATVIVLELDTPGGVVTSAIDICKYLKNLPVPTVAWINDQAYSAGTMLASACDFIVMSPSSTFGDSAPVSPAGELAPTERAKALSPVLAEYKDNARANGYDYAPFHAMCVLGVEVYLVEHLETGERRLVNQVDHAVMVRGMTPEDADAAEGVDPDAADEVLRISQATGSVLGEHQGKWRAVETLPSGATLPNGKVHDGTSLYTLNQTEAIDLGLAVAIVPDEAALQQRLSAATVTAVKQTWSESLAGYLTNPFVRGVLVLVVLVGGYLEFQSPGLGFPGGLAATALVVLIVAPFLVGLAEVWHVLVMVAGIGMLIVELVATPTFGLMGIAGIVMIIGGLALSIVPTGGGPLPMPAPGTGDLLLRSSLSTLAAFLLAAVAMAVITQFYGKIPFLNRLILVSNQAQRAGNSAAPPRDHLGGDHALGGTAPIAEGTSGVVSETGLRPSGRVEIDGRLVDAVSTGDFLDPGTAVRVTEVHGNRIVVDADGIA